MNQRAIEFYAYIMQGNVDKVKQYIEGVDINATFPAALAHACYMSNYDIVKLLLENKADPNAFNVMLSAACICGVRTLDLLVQHGGDIHGTKWRSPIHSVAFHGYCTLMYLIQHKADVNFRNGYNESPLDSAYRGQQWNAAKMLIDAGGKQNKPYKWPAELAAFVRQRNGVKKSLVTLYGVLRWKYRVPHEGWKRSGYPLPKDLVKQIVENAWDGRDEFYNI